MLFIVRGKNRDQNRCLRVNADSAEEAEAIGWKQGLFVTEVALVEKGSAVMTRVEQVAEWITASWRATPSNALKCFGKPISSEQSATLVLLGCATWVVNLKMFGFVQI